MLKDYLAECAPDNGPAGGDSEEAAETENGAAPSNKPPLPAKSALTSDQQTVLMSYVEFIFCVGFWLPQQSVNARSVNSDRSLLCSMVVSAGM